MVLVGVLVGEGETAGVGVCVLFGEYAGNGETQRN